MNLPAPMKLFGGPGHGLIVAELPPDTTPPLEWVYTDWVVGEGFVSWAYVYHGVLPSAGTIVYRYTGIRILPDPRLQEVDDG